MTISKLNRINLKGVLDYLVLAIGFILADNLSIRFTAMRAF
jgi:hypothetical protein